MKGVIFITGLCLMLPAVAEGQIDDLGTIDNLTGVRIAFSAEPEAIPKLWKQEPIAAEITALPADRRRMATEAVITAMRKYPPEIIRPVLITVYTVGDMYFYDRRRDGVYYKSSIFIYSGSIEVTAADIAVTFHHEFSSLLLRSHQEYFDSARWRALNPENFKYSEEISPNSPENTIHDSLENLQTQGFLSAYSTNSMEDDFNMLAERLLSNSASLWELANTYPALNKKLSCVIAFYGRLSPVFTEEYFKSEAKLANKVMMKKRPASPDDTIHKYSPNTMECPAEIGRVTK